MAAKGAQSDVGPPRVAGINRPLHSHVPPPPLQPRRTTLYFPKGLQHVYGNQMTWAYMGGFLV